ncbi:cyclase family protein [Botrimarina sp.]|uniref:cyclase family protein n=1 Tax=Botrimarina sp. TaxID=2795802 RepID=UPI0032EACE61
MTIHDLTHPLSPSTPVYPGDDGVAIDVVDVAAEPSPDAPRRLNNSRLSLGLHNGTHIDACFHFFNDRPTIDRAPLGQCCGPATVLDLSSTSRAGVIDLGDLESERREIVGRRVLLVHTGWDKRFGAADYFSLHPVITGEAARALVEWGVTLIGVDFPSVDRDPFEAHVQFLGAGTLIVENLRGLGALVGREVEFFALPLPVLGRDASPVRAIAIERDR